MFDPIKFFVIPQHTIELVVSARPPVPADFLSTYLESRPGILDRNGCDIFCDNCRSRTQQWSAFNLFEAVDDPYPADVIVMPFWLELFEATGQRSKIDACMNWLQAMPRHVPIVCQWNSDTDAAALPYFQNLPPNFIVLNFNTSKPTPNDLVCPFWAINTNPPGENIQPDLIAGFQGFEGTDLRRRLKSHVASRPGFFWTDSRAPEDEYFRNMRRCKFVLCPRGGGLSSYRVFEAIQCERVPVIFADTWSAPFPDLDFWKTGNGCIWAREDGDFGKLMAFLERCVDSKFFWAEMQARLAGVRREFSLAGIQERLADRIRLVQEQMK